MDVSLSTVNRAHMAYDQGGIKALKLKPCGGRLRENMTIAEEKELLVRFAKAAGAGEMLNIRAYEQQIGHKTSSMSKINAIRDDVNWLRGTSARIADRIDGSPANRDCFDRLQTRPSLAPVVMRRLD